MVQLKEAFRRFHCLDFRIDERDPGTIPAGDGIVRDRRDRHHAGRRRPGAWHDRDQKADTHAHMHARKRFGINVLSEGQSAISEHYADPERDSAGAERTGAHFDRTSHGTPVLHEALAYLECRLQDAREAGDHTIFIAEVEDVVVRDGSPLLFFGSEYRAIGTKLG